MKRKSDYVVERAVHGENFENEVIRLIVGQYGVSESEAKIAYSNCMSFDYAVVLPISEKYPNGVMIATDLYRQKVAVG
jgi:hypothetical protein